MTELDDLLPPEFKSDEDQLALDLAREGQTLLVRLIEARKSAGLTQEQVAEILGLSQATISAFERLGNDPRLSTIRRYARAVGVMVSHHVGPATGPACTSHLLSHVTDRGVHIHETAAAIARQLATDPQVEDESHLAWPAVATGSADQLVGV